MKQLRKLTPTLGMKVKASHVHTATLHKLGPVPRETETERETETQRERKVRQQRGRKMERRDQWREGGQRTKRAATTGQNCREGGTLKPGRFKSELRPLQVSALGRSPLFSAAASFSGRRDLGTPACKDWKCWYLNHYY